MLGRFGRLAHRVSHALLVGAIGLLVGGALLAHEVAPVAAGPPDRELPVWVEVPEQVYFPETGHHLAEPFLYYWRENDGRRLFGLPISEPLEDESGRRVQYFERAVLEQRPAIGGATELVVGRGAITNDSVNLRAGPGVGWGKVSTLRREARARVIRGPWADAEGAPWYLITGPFGTGWSKGEYLERHEDPIAPITLAVGLDPMRAREPAFRRLPAVVLGAFGLDTDELTVFPTTGHSLSGPFKRFWEAHRGATLLGLPVSEPFDEVSPADGNTYLTQYFEHAKLQYHPQAPPEDEIQPAALGSHAATLAGVQTAAVRRAGGAPDYDPELFVGPKWIEVNLSEQRLTAWDGDMPELTSLIRSGRPDWQTPTGTFRTFRKALKEDMTLGREGIDDWYYYTPGVPWVMYFQEGGFAIHGAFLDDHWGTPTSHGCVNTPLDIAEALYEWAPLGTIVWIHY